MEAAIAWLVQTILATLLIDKLKAWIRRVGLADDVEKLKSGIRRIQIVVSAVKERGVRNESLDESLALLKDMLYDADDAVDELDYYRLQEQVHGVTRDEPVDEISMGGAGTLNSSVGTLRSVVWKHFTITQKDNGKLNKAVCRHCDREFRCNTMTNGTTSMRKHLEKEHSANFMKKSRAHPPNSSSTDEPIVIPNSSRRGNKCWSNAWDTFDVIEEDGGKPIKARCKYCLAKIKCGTTTGTAGMLNHCKICKKKPRPNDQTPNLSSVGDADAITNPTPIVIGDSSSRKRRRVDEESTQIIVANTHTTWDKDTISSRIREITKHLQDIQGEVSEVFRLHVLSSSSDHNRSTTSDQHLRTSSLVRGEVYGRVAEENSIVKMITEEKSDGVVVLPIVGIAGVGKTTLAQLVYNDPNIECQFDQRIWVWVSHKFDEVRLTREMLNSISGERHEEIKCFAKLQEILKSHANSKRLLTVLDDVWDDMNGNIQWDKMLAPLISSHVKGNVILVTTRSMSVAQRLGTLKPVKLSGLANDDFWLLFKSRAFGYENCEEHQSLSIIGRQIAEKLKGNPLAAVSTGDLLRKKLNTDYWRNILKYEDWKSMKHSRGIMAALKLSYDQLPYHLQQCFSYCSIFPDSYQFLGGELVSFWISQGFVKSNDFSQRMEEIGRCYLIDLVNLGFFQEVKREQSYLGSQVMYALCGLMHDFAVMVSRTECATIDGLHCNKIPQTIRHLSIVTSFAYIKDPHGNICHDKKLEENLRNTVTSVSQLRTLVLLGHYDSSFLKVFQDKFKEAHNLRLLHMSARSAQFRKRGPDEVDGPFPQVLNKLYHLQVLDVGSYTDPNIPDGVNNLVSLRNLVVHKGVYSSIVTIGNMTSLEELHGLKFQITNNFEITQPQSMSELVQDWVHQLDNVKTLKEVYEAVQKKNELLEELHLSWRESPEETYVELLQMDESRPSSEPYMDTAREVLEGFEPDRHLEILQISGYSNATSSIGLASNISFTSLLTLQLHNCGEWQTVPSLGRFTFLTKLKLSNLQKVKEVLVPSLEELILVEMPKLEKLSCISVEGMSSSLRALQIEDCRALKEFDLFENNFNFGTERRPWLCGLRILILSGCPHLKVLKPLPPSTAYSDLRISGVSTLPYSMKGSSSEKLHIGYFDKDEDDGLVESSDDLRILDDKILAFHNLRNLKFMDISDCQNLRSFSFEGFSNLGSLTKLEISMCKELFSSDVMPEHTLEDATAMNYRAFPSLKSLSIGSCGIAGKWLSVMLQHAPYLEELNIDDCTHITTVLLPTEKEENSLSDLISDSDSSSGNPDDTSTWLAEDGLLQIPLDLVSSLKEIFIWNCPRLTFIQGSECFSGFASLEKLMIWVCPELPSSLVHKHGSDDGEDGRWLLPISLQEFNISGYSQETLQPCFPRDSTSLTKLEVWSSPDLQYLQLHSCTALEELFINDCESLAAIEGLQSLGNLGNLTVYGLRQLSACLESFSRLRYRLCSQLETLKIDDPSVLTTSFGKHLSTLQRLQLTRLKKVRRLTNEQERALLHLKSLQELVFSCCFDLLVLPVGLHNLRSLKKLKMDACQRISRLPETGLPLSLEELDIKFCSKKLADQCRLLETSKLQVKISLCS